MIKTKRKHIAIIPDFPDALSDKVKKDICSGIGEYCYNFLWHLNGLKTDLNFIVFVKEKDIKLLPKLNNNFRIIKIKYCGDRPFANLFWFFIVLPIHIKRYKINLLHLLSGNRYLPFIVKCPTIATIHDLRKLVIKNLYGHINSLYFKHILARLICKIDRILAVSHSTADDLNKFLDIDRSKIKVIHNACNESFARKLDKSLLDRIKSKYELNKPFILYVSRLEHPGKNHITLINAYTSLIKSNQIHHDLVLVGKNWNGAEKIIKTVKTNGISRNVKILGFVPRNDLTAIYTLADIFVFPSLAEGFGIPLLEAMASNTPVACSNINVFREIANKAAIYFDPTCLKSISNALLALTNDPKLKKVLSIHGKEQLGKYSWDENAKATLLQYNKILLN